MFHPSSIFQEIRKHNTPICIFRQFQCEYRKLLGWPGWRRLGSIGAFGTFAGGFGAGCRSPSPSQHGNVIMHKQLIALPLRATRCSPSACHKSTASRAGLTCKPAIIYRGSSITLQFALNITNTGHKQIAEAGFDRHAILDQQSQCYRSSNTTLELAG